MVREDLAAVFRHKGRITYEQFLHVIDDRKQGALRVSVGLATNFSDVYQRFVWDPEHRKREAVRRSTGE
jgi:hypothetical protein